MKIGLPVRSAIQNHCAVRLVVGWVTTSESLMLIVFVFFPGRKCFSFTLDRTFRERGKVWLRVGPVPDNYCRIA
jgi:hypothetical protein